MLAPSFCIPAQLLCLCLVKVTPTGKVFTIFMDIATEIGQSAGLLECKNSGRADCLSINSFSKYFSMTGWRLGCGAGWCLLCLGRLLCLDDSMEARF